MITLKNIKISEILTPALIINVKGGVAAQAIANANANSAVVGAVADDKRRVRPGGGITTL